MPNNYSRRDFIRNTSLLGVLPLIHSSPFITVNEFKQFGNVIEAPADPERWQQFREELMNWRKQTRKELNYNSSAYDAPAFKWTQSNYSCFFLFMYDQDFFDHEKNSYTTDKIIQRGIRELMVARSFH